MNDKQPKIEGSLLGLALGDAFGAPYEGGMLERLLWQLIGKSNGFKRYTDDTQMTIDIVESIIEHKAINQDDIAQRFANSYRWSRGYGPSAARLLKSIRKGQNWREANSAILPDGSFGNGGAMRSPIIGAIFADKEDKDLVQIATEVSEITHCHPLGVEGSVLIALASKFLYQNYPNSEVLLKLMAFCDSTVFSKKLRLAGNWLNENKQVSSGNIRKHLGNSITATESCVTAIYLALSHRNSPFVELLSSCRSLRGDVDTISAMAGGLWGAVNGSDKIPIDLLEQVENRNRLNALAEAVVTINV